MDIIELSGKKHMPPLSFMNIMNYSVMRPQPPGSPSCTVRHAVSPGNLGNHGEPIIWKAELATEYLVDFH